MNFKGFRRNCHWQRYEEERYKCPFNDKTEIFVVGFSDGGGFGMYLNYVWPSATGASVIDFWAYSAYEVWLQAEPFSGTMGAKIYTSCHTNMFDWGPVSIFSESGASPPSTYPDKAMSGTTFTAPVSTTALSLDGTTSADFHVWTWKNCNYGSRKALAFAVHGLQSGINFASPQAHDDAVWAQWVDNDGDGVAETSDLGTECGGTAISHSGMIDVSPVYNDIYEWETGSLYFGCSGRRLEEDGAAPEESMPGPFVSFGPVGKHNKKRSLAAKESSDSKLASYEHLVETRLADVATLAKSAMDVEAGTITPRTENTERMDYTKPSLGLEKHVELKTGTDMFTVNKMREDVMKETSKITINTKAITKF